MYSILILMVDPIPVLTCMMHGSLSQDFNGAWWAFIPKVIADQTVWSIFLNAAYSTTIMSLQGMSPPKVSESGEWDDARDHPPPVFSS